MDVKGKYGESEDLKGQVIDEKLLSAESYSATVRMAVVLINSVAYLFLMDRENTIPWLAYTIIVASFIYSFYVVVYRPYENRSLLLTSHFTFITDGIFVTLWIMATGYSESPFYLLWYVSIIAVGQRFSFKETLFTSGIYALIYVALLRVDIGAIASAEMFVRVLYIPITGALAAFFSREFENQVEDKLMARKSEVLAVEAIKKQQDLLEELRSIQKNLERIVEERTSELQQVNEDLKHEVQEKETAQRAQAQMLESLERTNAELESFAYVTSHDLKAPLRGISTIADWLQSDYADRLDDEGRNNLILLKKRVQRMHDLIEGILKYAKAGQQNEEVETMDVERLIRETINLIVVPEHASVSVEGSFPIVEVNRTLFLQVLENLLSNASKHVDDEKGEITISGSPNEHGWTISVSDNGPGIPEGYREKVFEMFQTLGTGSNAESTGVGLAIVKKIILGWGGKVWVDEAPSGGATFRFTIPNEIVNSTPHARTG